MKSRIIAKLDELIKENDLLKTAPNIKDMQGQALSEQLCKSSATTAAEKIEKYTIIERIKSIISKGQLAPKEGELTKQAEAIGSLLFQEMQFEILLEAAESNSQRLQALRENEIDVKKALSQATVTVSSVQIEAAKISGKSFEHAQPEYIKKTHAQIVSLREKNITPLTSILTKLNIIPKEVWGSTATAEEDAPVVTPLESKLKPQAEDPADTESAPADLKRSSTSSLTASKNLPPEKIIERLNNIQKNVQTLLENSSEEELVLEEVDEDVEEENESTEQIVTKIKEQLHNAENLANDLIQNSDEKIAASKILEKIKETLAKAQQRLNQVKTSTTADTLPPPLPAYTITENETPPPPTTQASPPPVSEKKSAPLTAQPETTVGNSHRTTSADTNTIESTAAPEIAPVAKHPDTKTSEPSTGTRSADEKNADTSTEEKTADIVTAATSTKPASATTKPAASVAAYGTSSTDEKKSATNAETSTTETKHEQNVDEKNAHSKKEDLKRTNDQLDIWITEIQNLTSALPTDASESEKEAIDKRFENIKSTLQNHKIFLLHEQKLLPEREWKLAQLKIRFIESIFIYNDKYQHHKEQKDKSTDFLDSYKNYSELLIKYGKPAQQNLSPENKQIQEDIDEAELLAREAEWHYNQAKNQKKLTSKERKERENKDSKEDRRTEAAQTAEDNIKKKLRLIKDIRIKHRDKPLEKIDMAYNIILEAAEGAKLIGSAVKNPSFDLSKLKPTDAVMQQMTRIDSNIRNFHLQRDQLPPDNFTTPIESKSSSQSSATGIPSSTATGAPITKTNNEQKADSKSTEPVDPAITNALQISQQHRKNIQRARQIINNVSAWTRKANSIVFEGSNEKMGLIRYTNEINRFSIEIEKMIEAMEALPTLPDEIRQARQHIRYAQALITYEESYEGAKNPEDRMSDILPLSDLNEEILSPSHSSNADIRFQDDIKAAEQLAKEAEWHCKQALNQKEPTWGDIAGNYFTGSSNFLNKLKYTAATTAAEEIQHLETDATSIKEKYVNNFPPLEIENAISKINAAKEKAELIQTELEKNKSLDLQKDKEFLKKLKMIDTLLERELNSNKQLRSYGHRTIQKHGDYTAIDEIEVDFTEEKEPSDAKINQESKDSKQSQTVATHTGLSPSSRTGEEGAPPENKSSSESQSATSSASSTVSNRRGSDDSDSDDDNDITPEDDTPDEEIEKRLDDLSSTGLATSADATHSHHIPEMLQNGFGGESLSLKLGEEFKTLTDLETTIINPVLRKVKPSERAITLYELKAQDYKKQESNLLAFSVAENEIKIIKEAKENVRKEIKLLEDSLTAIANEHEEKTSSYHIAELYAYMKSTKKIDDLKLGTPKATLSGIELDLSSPGYEDTKTGKTNKEALLNIFKKLYSLHSQIAKKLYLAEKLYETIEKAENALLETYKFKLDNPNRIRLTSNDSNKIITQLDAVKIGNNYAEYKNAVDAEIKKHSHVEPTDTATPRATFDTSGTLHSVILEPGKNTLDGAIVTIRSKEDKESKAECSTYTVITSNTDQPDNQLKQGIILNHVSAHDDREGVLLTAFIKNISLQQKALLFEIKPNGNGDYQDSCRNFFSIYNEFPVTKKGLEKFLKEQSYRGLCGPFSRFGETSLSSVAEGLYKGYAQRIKNDVDKERPSNNLIELAMSIATDYDRATKGQPMKINGRDQETIWAVKCALQAIRMIYTKAGQIPPQFTNYIDKTHINTEPSRKAIEQTYHYLREHYYLEKEYGITNKAISEERGLFKIKALQRRSGALPTDTHHDVEDIVNRNVKIRAKSGNTALTISNEIKQAVEAYKEQKPDQPSDEVVVRRSHETDDDILIAQSAADDKNETPEEKPGDTPRPS